VATKASPSSIKDLGFIAEEFGTPPDFDAFLQAVLDEQEALLSDRVGTATVANSLLATHVVRAEKCLTAAELLQRRINRLASSIDADTASVMSTLKKARQDYLDESERIILKLAAGSVTDGADFASGVCVTSHFDGLAF
jgi:hypothetical protein